MYRGPRCPGPTGRRGRRGAPAARAACAPARRSTSRDRNPSRSTLAHPRLRYRPSLLEIIDHEDQLMVMIAVLDFDIDAGLGHAPRDLAELAGLPLEVGDTYAVHDERASTLDAHPGASQCFPHLGQRAWTVLQRDGQIFHWRRLLTDA